ncbi:MAG: putative toxin-antitoxin system toxin component, PIN family [Terriglobia bacterium]
MAGRPRAVLDTNVFVSGVINAKGFPAAVLKALRSRAFILVSSPPINEEIIEVLNRPRIRDRYGVGDRIFDVSFILWELAELVIDPPDVKVSSDPNDDKFIATAIAGKADYLVTGDVHHLLNIGEYQGVTIIPPKEFVAILRA